MIKKKLEAFNQKKNQKKLKLNQLRKDKLLLNQKEMMNITIKKKKIKKEKDQNHDY